ncbi:unnamed protein product, partial [Rhizoctonia solani]
RLMLNVVQSLIVTGAALRRLTSGDTVIDGKKISNGTFLAFSVGETHSDPSIYPNPEQYNPGRYTEEQDKGQTYSFLGWGAGRHPCAGRRFAQYEIKSMVAMFLASYTYEVVNDRGKKPDPSETVPDKNNLYQASPSQGTNVLCQVYQEEATTLVYLDCNYVYAVPLKDQIATLTQVVNARPPLEQVQALQKEYQNLELILQGTQRENERCMTELEKSKRKEKMMEAELAKVYGEDWAANLGLPTSSPSISRALPVSASATANVRQSPPPQARSEETSDGPSNAAINEHLEAVRMLVLGMDAKLAEREAQISKEMARAEEETQRAASARKKIGV